MHAGSPTLKPSYLYRTTVDDRYLMDGRRVEASTGVLPCATTYVSATARYGRQRAHIVDRRLNASDWPKDAILGAYATFALGATEDGGLVILGEAKQPRLCKGLQVALTNR
jgi:hypothetical protein